MRKYPKVNITNERVVGDSATSILTSNRLHSCLGIRDMFPTSSRGEGVVMSDTLALCKRGKEEEKGGNEEVGNGM